MFGPCSSAATRWGWPETGAGARGAPAVPIGRRGVQRAHRVGQRLGYRAAAFERLGHQRAGIAGMLRSSASGASVARAAA